MLLAPLSEISPIGPFQMSWILDDRCMHLPERYDSGLKFPLHKEFDLAIISLQPV